MLNVFKVNKDTIVWKNFTFNKYWNRVSFVSILLYYYIDTYFILQLLYTLFILYTQTNININKIGARHISDIKD